MSLTINPSETGDALFKKTPHTARGAVGTFTFDLLNRSTKKVIEKIAITYSVPYDYNLYYNWYAVGIFSKSQRCSDNLYKRFDIRDNDDDSFVWGKASGSGLHYENDQVTVMASMTDTYEPDMQVEVRDK